MDIRQPNTSSAAVILEKRLAAMGVDLKHTQALEIVAAMQGFQSYQALKAHEDEKKHWEAPHLKLSHPNESGSDYDYIGPEGDSVWVRVRNVSVYIRGADEGVSVDLFPYGLEDFDSEAGTWFTYAEAADNLLDAIEEGWDDRMSYVQRICQENGIRVSEDVDQDGLWVWTLYDNDKFIEGCPMSLNSEEEAWLDAYKHVFQL